jgi:hypothetical protein
MNRRILLASLLPAAASAQSALRARPGQPTLPYQARMITDAEFGPWLQVDVGTLGSVRLPSHHRRAAVLGRVNAAGREVLLARFEGPRFDRDGEQMLQALIGFDNAGQLRVLGIETRTAKVMSGAVTRETDGRLAAVPTGFAITMSMRGRGMPSLRWNTNLPWDGEGTIDAPATPPGSPAERTQVDDARREVAAYLAAEPRLDFRAVPLRDWKIFRVGQI